MLQYDVTEPQVRAYEKHRKGMGVRLFVVVTNVDRLFIDEDEQETMLKNGSATFEKLAEKAASAFGCDKNDIYFGVLTESLKKRDEKAAEKLWKLSETHGPFCFTDLYAKIMKRSLGVEGRNTSEILEILGL